MVNPVELLAAARKRLALIAACGALVYALLPAIASFALALAIRPLNTWARYEFGYELEPSILANLRAGLIAAGLIDLGFCAALALRAWRRAYDPVAAAERVDSAVNAKQEIVTLATLSDPSRPSAKYQRTALFPILWRRAAAYLARFDPARAFRFQLGRPIKRGSALALATVVLFGLSMMALVRPPLPAAAEAHRLREIARAIEKSSADAESQALAKALRHTAAELENPKLPPEKKLAMLEEVMRDVKRQQEQRPEASKGSESGKGNSAGNESGKGEGKGSGQGKGTGTGQGTNQEATGSGEGKKNQQQIAKLEKELTKAEERIENESGPKDQSIPKPAPGEKNGSALKPGENPNQPGSANQPGATGENTIPKQGESGAEKPGQGGKQNAANEKSSTKGDTHLGEFPAPVRYERFYKPGEKGPPIDIRDARYVVFRLPSETVSGGGKTVLSSERPTESTPYSNLPLKAQQLQAAPDERQQVPPRYRDLIQ